MPTLADLTASQVVKLLLIGDSGTGKTGSIASLVKAGYHVRMLDMDNGWESLAAAVQRTCPAALPTVQVEPLRDKYKASPIGPVVDGFPKAFPTAMGLLERWVDGSNPAEWGGRMVLVLDSLTFFSRAAFAWASAMNPNAKDKRQVYWNAQTVVGQVLSFLTGPSFNTNLIVTAHIEYTDTADGTTRGYPTSVGKALGPTIPSYFNSYAACVTQPGGKRTIQTLSTTLIDLKNPKSFEMEASLPIETGLATFFSTLRGSPTWETNEPNTSAISPVSTPPSEKEKETKTAISMKPSLTLKAISPIR